MASNVIPSSTSPPTDLTPYSKWPEVFRSWFWRFYDHLFQLIFYNFGWALTCLSVSWLFFHFGWIDVTSRIQFIHVYLLYLVENALSIGWAYVVFQIFFEGHAKPSDIWVGFRKYFLKATVVSGASGLVIGLATYNIYFYFFLENAHRFLSFSSMVFTCWALLFWLISCLYQWPILFFQNPPIHKIFYKSFLLVLGNGLTSLLTLAFFIVCFGLFSAVLFPWFFIGAVFFFSFQCVTLEKNLLKYKIIYKDAPLEPFLHFLDNERQRSWRHFFKPWENR